METKFSRYRTFHAITFTTLDGTDRIFPADAIDEFAVITGFIVLSMACRTDTRSFFGSHYVFTIPGILLPGFIHPLFKNIHTDPYP